TPASDRLVDALGRVPQTRGVVALYLFGSAADGRMHRESDVDVGVLLDHAVYTTARDRFEARLALISELTARLPGRQADVVVLNEAPPGLAQRIVTARPPVYCSDPATEH